MTPPDSARLAEIEARSCGCVPGRCKCFDGRQEAIAIARRAMERADKAEAHAKELIGDINKAGGWRDRRDHAYKERDAARAEVKQEQANYHRMYGKYHQAASDLARLREALERRNGCRHSCVIDPDRCVVHNQSVWACVDLAKAALAGAEPAHHDAETAPGNRNEPGLGVPPPVESGGPVGETPPGERPAKPASGECPKCRHPLHTDAGCNMIGYCSCQFDGEDYSPPQPPPPEPCYNNHFLGPNGECITLVWHRPNCGGPNCEDKGAK